MGTFNSYGFSAEGASHKFLLTEYPAHQKYMQNLVYVCNNHTKLELAYGLDLTTFSFNCAVAVILNSQKVNQIKSNEINPYCYEN